MALIRRQRYILTNLVRGEYTPGGGMPWSYSWKSANVLQEVPSAMCWRCKKDYKRGDNLVHIAINSEDVVKPNEIYHYRCIPSAKWNQDKFAGSLPAWELPSDESPVENTGTSSAAEPTL